MIALRASAAVLATAFTAAILFALSGTMAATIVNLIDWGF